MAEDDKTTVAAADAAPPKKKGSNLLLFIGVGVGCIAAGVAVAIFLLKPAATAADGSAPAETAEVDDGHGKKKKEKKEKKEDGHGGGGEHGDGAAEATVFTVKDLVVNPAGTGGSRFLSVSISFAVDDAEQVADLQANEPVLRDALITILSSKTVSQLTDAKEKELIRLQIKKRVMQLLETEELAGVYYNDFVLQ